MQYRDSQGGAQYPRSLGEFQSWFATDADCLDYLEWLRWPDGFVCPRCEKVGYPHDRRSRRAAKALGEDIGKLLPGVHRIASLAKRWLLSTHQGAVHIEHLPGY